jgi:hypothetical protein
VRSEWKACQLGLPAFANNWENAQELATANRQVELPKIVQRQELTSTIDLELTEKSIGINN